MKLKGKKLQAASAYQKSGCNISEACRVADIERQTFYNWLNADPDFKSAIEEAKEKLLDFAESKLVEQIQTGITPALIFFLKTQGKQRGYTEKVQTELSGSVKIEPITGMEID